MNAERCLLAGEALGLGYAALKKSTDYARERIVFGRPIGQNQAIQHPLADAYMHLEAAKLATYHAASLYDRSSPDHPKHDPSITTHAVGVACNSAKYLAAEAAFTACERSVMSMGGMGYAAEYHVERYMRECFVPRIAPVSRVSDDSRYPLMFCQNTLTDRFRETGNDHELCGREGPQTTSKLLDLTRCSVTFHCERVYGCVGA
jgi:hypothetical protein